MPQLDAAGAIAAVKTLLEIRESDLDELTSIHSYYLGRQAHPAVPTTAPDDVKRLAKISRVNMMKLVVSTQSQSLYVDGFRQRLADDNADVWDTWLQNRLNARQLAIHRSALTYGFSYATVLPGEPSAVIKGYSPLRMTAMYGDDDDWPLLALRVDDSGKGFEYRLYDESAVYFLAADGDPMTEGTAASISYISADNHSLGVTPVVRFLNEQDLDDDNEGEVGPLRTLQDQVDFTTFGLLVAQHFAAFRQRFIMGWMAEDETTLLKTGAAKIMTFEDPDVKVGEFAQTDLAGYISSREETLKELASISQTPVHELIGALANLSAEALVAAEAGQRRKIVERQTSFGESWEQVLDLAAQLDGSEIDDEAEVRWRDTESRTLAAVVDALGKIATQLNVPPEELWEKIPGVTQAEIARWKQRLDEMGPLPELERLLNRQNESDSGAEA